jgi:hypothetical protein
MTVCLLKLGTIWKGVVRPELNDIWNLDGERYAPPDTHKRMKSHE